MNVKSMISVEMLIAAVVVGICGYILLGVAPVDNTLSWSLAPIILVFCYLVLIPLSVLLKKPKTESGK